ncbi:MAG: type II toxin-antitoxin system HicA family toxin [Victivallales bacterium]|nr:type II toxin-antitoxin system HicA family toxin [Victivallales bacterium]
MPELPHLSGSEIVKVLQKMGFHIARQRGSHVVLRKENRGCVVPMHKEVAVGTLKSAIKQAGIEPEEFIMTYRNR